MNNSNLIRFNNIAIQVTPQMAAEMEANRDSKCTFLLNPTLTYDIFVYYALEHIDNTSIHTIIIYFIPYIDGPPGKGRVSKIQSTLLFHQRVSNAILYMVILYLILFVIEAYVAQI